MKKVLSKLTMASAAALVSLSAQADLVLDNFSVHQSEFAVTSGTSGSGSAEDTSVGCVNIMGCYRNILIDNSAPSSNGTASAVVTVNNTTLALGAGNELVFSVNGGSFARAILTWDGDDNATNFGAFAVAQDFSDLNALAFFVKSDGGIDGGKIVQVTLKDINGLVSDLFFPAENTVGQGPNNYAPVALSFAGFSNPVGFDYSQIVGVQAIVNLDATTESLDFSLRQVNVIPEPASIALAGLALLGIGAARRRK